jgi:ABC-2 type transport system permease protein
VGILLIGAGFLAIGLFASSVTQNQIIAAMITFAVLLFDWIIAGTASAFDPSIGDVLGYVGFLNHVDSFAKGIIAVPDVIYALTVIGVPLYFAVVALGARKWH